jgi:mRNA-degrading endonuclease HigB of HigAB toxin-antitoxin module
MMTNKPELTLIGIYELSTDNEYAILAWYNDIQGKVFSSNISIKNNELNNVGLDINWSIVNVVDNKLPVFKLELIEKIKDFIKVCHPWD